jgi:hypothetical protein
MKEKGIGDNGGKKNRRECRGKELERRKEIWIGDNEWERNWR